MGRGILHWLLYGQRKWLAIINDGSKSSLLVIIYCIIYYCTKLLFGQVKEAVVIKATGAKNGEASRGLAVSDQAVESNPEIAFAEETFSKLLQLVRTIQSGMQGIEGSHGLSGSQLWTLWQLSAQPGLRVTQLAVAQHIHPSTASNLLDKLEARGLVRRERRDADNRVVRLYLTETGHQLAKDIPGPLQGRLRHALKEMPSPELEALLKGVTSVLNTMSEPLR